MEGGLRYAGSSNDCSAGENTGADTSSRTAEEAKPPNVGSAAATEPQQSPTQVHCDFL